MLDKIYFINHDCFRIEGDVVVYTDPFHVPDNLPKADLILISKLKKDDTTFVAIDACKGQLSGDVKIVKAGDKLEAKGVAIEVVPAYNTDKDFHPKAQGHVGYIFTMGGQRIYFAGDTDHIDEMKDFNCDIALLPVSGTYVMTAEQAVGAAKDIGPKVVIPMHYGDIVGTKEDAVRFSEMYDGETVIK
jgi:L-ascorbate metabolism protein UlaG (beta-lactamase superfamily)